MTHTPADRPIREMALLENAVRSVLRPRCSWPSGKLAACAAAVVTAAAPLAAWGKELPPFLDLSLLQAAQGGDGSLGVVMNGSDTSHYSWLADVAGISVALAGDMNGDGVGDMMIGAYWAEPIPDGRGAVYVVFGKPSGFSPELELESLLPQFGGDGANGFVIAGEDVVSGDVDSFGRTCAGGDLNGDGFGDALVGALNRTAGPGGRAYVLFGSPAGFEPLIRIDKLLPENGGDGTEGVVFDGEAAGLETGSSVAFVGDVNGDGLDDIALGSTDQNDDDGAVYVIFGKLSGWPALYDLGRLLPENGGDGSEGYIVYGRRIGGSLGDPRSIGHGDINKDGMHDVVLGAGLAEEAYVLYGREHMPPEFRLDTLLPGGGGDGSEGIAILGIKSGGLMGASVSSGDVNGDGFADIALGAPLASRARAPDAGESYVIFGTAAPLPAVFELSSLLPNNGGDGSSGFVVYGIDREDEAGHVTAVGDLNHDGVDDLVIGADEAGPGRSSDDAGQVYLYFGHRNDWPAELDPAELFPENGGDGSVGVVFEGIDAEDFTGHALSGSAGDVNGDGIDDLLLGAPGEFEYLGFYDRGRAHIVFGAASDSDDDDVSDMNDNCLEIANTDQRDTDEDGLGNICDADLDNNCFINFADLGLLKSAFFQVGDLSADLNGDMSVNFLDLALMKQGFFGAPGPSGVPNDCAAEN